VTVYYGKMRGAGPMQVWPRPGYDGKPDGPLAFARGPQDFEGLGREKFWDQSPDERRDALKAMVSDAGRSTSDTDMRHFRSVFESKQFARGWLNELENVRRYSK
jgi:hypothetical protein